MVKTTVDYSGHDSDDLKSLLKERKVKPESQSRESMILALLASEGAVGVVVGISKSHPHDLDGKDPVVDESFVYGEEV